MDNQTLSNLIGLIYDAAFDVDLWPRLMQSLSDALEPLLAEPRCDIPTAGMPAPVDHAENAGIINPTQTSQTVDFQTEPRLDAPECHQGHRLSKHGLVDLLRSHFCRALELNRQIFEAREERNAMHHLFEKLPLGMLIADNRGRVLTCNQKMNQIISDGKGLCIKNNLLCAMSSTHTAQLHKLIREVAGNGDRQGDTIHLQQPGMPLSALVVPFESDGSSNGNATKKVIVLAAAPELHTQISTDILMSLYRLTGAEAKLLSSLVQNRSLNAIAEEFGISKHTIRNQLKSVYEKTGTHRQTELVHQVITGPAMLAALANNEHAPLQNGLVSNKVVSVKQTGSRRHQMVQLPDGRRLGFAEYGLARGRPVMLMHAANGSRLERHPDETIIHDCGIRLIIPERPGVGLSDNRPRLTLFNWVEDVACLADHLSLKSFNIIGYSLGAAFAWACAHKLKERIGRIVTVAGITPYDSIWDLKGMYAPVRLVLSLGRYAHTLLEPMVGLFNFRFSPEAYEKALFHNLAPVDQVLVRDRKIRNRILENVMENMKRGEHTTLQEAFIVSRHWGFDLGAIAIPAEVWHGEQDRLIPVQMAHNLAKKLPNCRTHFLPGAGHYLLFHSWKEILLSAVSREIFPRHLKKCSS